MFKKIKSLPKIPLKKTSRAERLVDEATNDNCWGPSSTQLNELSQLSGRPRDLQAICKTLDKRLRSRHTTEVLKSLTVVYFLLQTGSADFLNWVETEKYLFKSLVEYDDTGRKSEKTAKAAGSVRHKAEEISRLLDDSELLQQKRAEFKNLRADMKLPTPRSSLDNPAGSGPGASGISTGRQTRSLDIYNRGEIMRDIDTMTGSTSPPLRVDTASGSGAVFSANRYADYGRATSPTTRSKLSNIVEMDAE